MSKSVSPVGEPLLLCLADGLAAFGIRRMFFVAAAPHFRKLPHHIVLAVTRLSPDFAKAGVELEIECAGTCGQCTAHVRRKYQQLYGARYMQERLQSRRHGLRSLTCWASCSVQSIDDLRKKNLLTCMTGWSRAVSTQSGTAANQALT